LRTGNPTLNELADVTGHERSALWRTLQPLVKTGLMTLAADKGQRAGKVAVTAKGRQVVREALPLWEASQTRVLQLLGVDAEKEFLETLKKVEQLGP
jgi:DNA-binding MarR family transcriptional regulator